MSTPDEVIARLALAAGISQSFTDPFHRRKETGVETNRALLAALGLPAETEAQARESGDRLAARRRTPLAPVIVLPAGRAVRVVLEEGVGRAHAAWRLELEDGSVREGRGPVALDGGPHLPLRALPAGYHDLLIEIGGDPARATLIVAPRRCWQPRALDEHARLWGATAQLYGLRGESDLGIGDYPMAGEAAEAAARFGASFLGLSPLHAQFHADRSKISPYSPSSRLFLDTLFLDPRRMAGFAESGAAALLATADARAEIAALRAGTLVDHARVAALKVPVFEHIWSHGGMAADPGWLAFRQREGDALTAHATFEALSEHFRAEGRNWPGEWPEPFRACAAPEVVAFRERHADRVGFHAWLQWQADRQLAEAGARVRASGMSIGLYRDLAVGADRGGSEVWAQPGDYMAGVRVGAPPDPLGPQGQDWGLPAFHPLALEDGGLAGFRRLVAANMRHAGAIRIDHAFQLRRLFVIPRGMPASEGAYLDYPFAAMLAVLRVESHRARCMVIAEDLGNAPEGFSEAIMDAGAYSYRVLFFEREADGAFRAPAAYPERALAVCSTHDLPTFLGWWRGLDIDLRQTLGVYDSELAEQERGRRGDEKRRLVEALATEGLLSSPEMPADAPAEAALRYLARTASGLAGLQLEDAAGELVQANLPGISEGHPNWRRRLPMTLEELSVPGGPLARAGAGFAAEGRGERPRAALAAPPPRATYRLQFHKDFTFDHAVAILPYLKALGISHLYASPIQMARPGSAHGYDIVDHARINPELGGEDGFVRLSDALRGHGLGLILDIVPNHMGVGGADNGWWLSVLEWGELSPMAAYFDIDWGRLGAGGKLVLPFLGARYGVALEAGDLALRFDAAEGSFSVWHFEHRFPVCPLAYPIVLDRALAALDEGDPAAGEVVSVSERLRQMGEEVDPARRRELPGEAEALKARLRAAVADSPPLAAAIERAAVLINGTPGAPDSFGTLHRILEAQAYRLAYWRVAASDINYRRFFDINTLAGLRMEEPALFAAAHELIFRLVREGRVQGLRIDHIDGLADPDGYVRALQAAVGPGFYVVVEKILEPGERLRDWPVAGTTGYDALNLIDGVLVDQGARNALERLYRDVSGIEGGYGALLRAAKTHILEASFASELEVLTSDVKRIADSDRLTRDYTVPAIRRALVEIIARFPVYRTYLTEPPAAEEDRRLVDDTVEAARRRTVLPDDTVHDLIAAILLDGESDGARRFCTRFQQLTGPVMAKSLEDTLFYRFVRLLALNEVGGDPDRFGISVAGFHAANAERAARWPNAMLASATHDTKRGEDARARLLALSESLKEWTALVRGWKRACAGAGSDGSAPDANDRYLILQSLLGAWPFEDGEAALAALRERMGPFVEKALREAKRHTSWTNPDPHYERASLAFLDAVLAPGSRAARLAGGFARQLARAGAVNALARTALKYAVPGVPDTYQGTESWDLSLVDPDNRRPVDYAALAAALNEGAPPEALLAAWRDGRIKQRLIARMLADRAARPALYAEGDYRPLAAGGAGAERILAFARSHKGEALAVIVPRLSARMLGAGDGLSFAASWGDTTVELAAGSWTDIVTGTIIEIAEGGHPIQALMAVLPLAVLKRTT